MPYTVHGQGGPSFKQCIDLIRSAAHNYELTRPLPAAAGVWHVAWLTNAFMAATAMGVTTAGLDTEPASDVSERNSPVNCMGPALKEV